MTQEREKVIEKIKKMLMTTTENGASEEEAQAFMLRAQKLMLKHGLSMSDIETEGQAVKEVVEEPGSDFERRVWWKGRLASIIAENFRCYTFFTNYGNGMMRVKFLGLKEDVEIAIEVFKYASEIIPYHAKKYVNKRKKELEKQAGIDFKKDFDTTEDIIEWALEQGYLTEIQVENLRFDFGHDEKIFKMRVIMKTKEGMGITVNGTALRNDYIAGFLSGLEDKFREQVQNNEWGLVLVKDKEVQNVYEEMSKDFRMSKASTARVLGDQHARASGYKQGKAFNGAPKGYIKG